MQNSKKLFVQCLSILFIFNSLNIVAQDNEESVEEVVVTGSYIKGCLLYTSPSPRDT